MIWGQLEDFFANLRGIQREQKWIRGKKRAAKKERIVKCSGSQGIEAWEVHN